MMSEAPHRGAKRWLAIVAPALVAVLILGAAGYALGRASAPDEVDTRQEHQEAEAAAMNSAESRAAGDARARGSAKGRRAGAAGGRRAGRRRGTKRAEQLIAQQQAESQQTAQAANCDNPRALPTPANCPAPPDGRCGFYMELQPDGSCGEKTPDPAGPGDCPPGWTPAGIYGACAPPPGAAPESGDYGIEPEDR